MSNVVSVGSKLEPELTPDGVDARPLARVLGEVIRLWRMHKNYEIMKGRRLFPEVLACFHFRSSQVQCLKGKGEFAGWSHRCVEHFARCNSPSQETIQLQVTAEGTLFGLTQKFLENSQKGRDKLREMLDSIIEIEVEDARQLYETVEVLHSKIMAYLAEFSRQVNHQHCTELDPEVDEAEILAGLESVLPRNGLLYWMELPVEEKAVQVEELAEIVMGIRVFNK